MAEKKIVILIESDYYEHEIWYYHSRFAESGVTAIFASRLWGQERLVFTGHEYKAPLECRNSFETITDDELDALSAVIVPSGIVSDRLRFTDDRSKMPPACEFLRRAFLRPHVIKGIICHGLWLTAPIPGLVKGRKLTCHNNLHGDAIAYGAEYVDEDLVEDGDLITARTGAHAHLLARAILKRIDAI